MNFVFARSADQHTYRKENREGEAEREKRKARQRKERYPEREKARKRKIEQERKKKKRGGVWYRVSSGRSLQTNTFNVNDRRA